MIIHGYEKSIVSVSIFRNDVFHMQINANIAPGRRENNSHRKGV